MATNVVLVLLVLQAFAPAASAMKLGFWGNTSTGAWPHYPSRVVTSLEGEWEFCFIPGTRRIEEAQSFLCSTQPLKVPGVMHNPAPGKVPMQGTGIYRKEVQVEVDRVSLLHFHGCAFTCRVFVDSKLLVDHRSGGYSPFWLELPVVEWKIRRLVVVAERFWDPDIMPAYLMMSPSDVERGVNVDRMAGGDMTHWGGLHRDVFLHKFAHNIPRYIKAASVVPKLDLGHITIRIQFHTIHAWKRRSPFKIGDDMPVRLCFDDAQCVENITARLISPDGAHISNMTVPEAKTWSPQAPHLHTVRVDLLDNGQTIDSVVTRFGLRRIKATKEGILLNGRRIILKGVNRHHNTPASGSAMTLEEIRRDVDLLQELGVNFVRGAHYQQDQRFLDLLDERGILSWEEPLTWGNSEDRVVNPHYRAAIVKSVQEMVAASTNHPSVIIWGLFNEGPVHSNGSIACDTYKELADTIRDQDSTRLITWANNLVDGNDEAAQDMCERHVHADVISINAYPGWYTNCVSTTCIQDHWRGTVNFQRHRTRKPILISEFGAEGVWEVFGEEGSPQPYSQRYQAHVVKASIDVLKSLVDGIAVWQFADIRANDANTALTNWSHWVRHGNVHLSKAYENDLPDYFLRMPRRDNAMLLQPRCKDSVGKFPAPVDCGSVVFPPTARADGKPDRRLRPKGMNNKGLLDFWRRKKLAFETVKRAYAAMPMR
mmetsp:Transcript_7486/g.17756  ORF Transcript_7486/g.17756 Transcript_7486/m.17756 type:complete len:711 (+) Transcript_7486:90-2222(+)